MQNKKCAPDDRVLIIAEAGVNHNGDVSIANRMVRVASECGADAIKFQTFEPERLAVESSPLARYQQSNLKDGVSQLDMLRSLRLSEKDHRELFERCRNNNILFLSSCFDEISAEFLYNLGVEYFKIPSGEIADYPLLCKVGSFRKRVILSTGMATIDEIQFSLKVLSKAGTPREKIVVLHCNTAYPTPFEDANLNAIVTIGDKLRVITGYSDHTLGVEAAVAAVALGAKVVEKHFTLDKTLEGPDHRASLDPEELCRLVSSIRNVEKALGDGMKRPSPSEAENMTIVRKSIVASKSIERGERFTSDNVAAKRPGTGLSPSNWNKVIGRRAKRNFKKDEPIEL